MSAPRRHTKDAAPSSDIIFEVPATPQPAKEHFGDIPLFPVRKRDGEMDPTDFPTPLPSLPYSNPPVDNRASVYSEGTEYNPPQRGSTLIAGPGGARKRGHYVSLSEAIADNTRPEFNPERLYGNGGGPDADTTLVGRDHNPSKFSGKYDYAAYPNTPYDPTDTDFLQTPSPSLFPGGLPKPPKPHPFSKLYEAPKWKTLGVHFLACLLAYPFLYVIVLAAKGKTLFWTRLLVGAGCGIAGFVLGLSLITLARRHLEAAAWATVIHQSRYHDSPGVRLKDLAPHAEDPVSAWTGFLLLWNRRAYPGTARKYRAHYDPRPWSIHIIFFLLLVVVAGGLPFVFGRIISIDTEVVNQRSSYHEVGIKGDISDDDIARATELKQPFNDFRLTWTLAPYSSHGGLPPVATLPWSSSQDKTDMIYFSETTKSQLQPDGSGFGTFETEVLNPSLDTEQRTSVSLLQAGLSPGSIVRQPRWGVRAKCDIIPDLQTNLIPISTNLSMTYVFLQKDTVKNLLDYFGLPFPTTFKPPTMFAGDQEWPTTVDQDKTLVAVNFYHNGVSHAYYSRPLYGMGQDDTGFVSLEMVLVRLNSSYTPQGNFPVRGDPIPDINGTATYIGYDAAVCIELFEPWIVEVYNSTVGSPTSLGIVEKSNVVRDFNTDSNSGRETRKGPAIDEPSVRRELTSKRIQAIYEAAHTNSINQVIKDNGRDSYYVPSPIVVSYSTGQGAYGYTSLSVDHFQKAKTLADANNILPYFAGSGSIVSRIYPDRVLAFAYLQPLQLIVALAIVFILGFTAALFVPRLPLNVPRRGFELYSWVAAFYADELVGVGKGSGSGGNLNDGEAASPGLPIGRRMEIEDIEQHLGDVRFRYMP